jgi:hypothetical protein
MESKVKTDGVEINQQPDGSYYNTGSCVHPLSITGIEITFEDGPKLRLVEWGVRYGINTSVLNQETQAGYWFEAVMISE